jgi:hypothetical protein
VHLHNKHEITDATGTCLVRTLAIALLSSAFVLAILLVLAIRHTQLDVNQDDSDSITERRKLLEEEKVSITPASFKPQVHVDSSWIR